MLLLLGLFIIISFIFIIIFIMAYFYYQFKLKQAHSKIQSQQSQLQNLNQQLAEMQTQLQQAIQDPLTHLPSWVLFQDRVKQSLNESVRYQFIMAILFIDIDEFKLINEALGHEIGDAVLLEVSQRLQACIRQVDGVTRYTNDVFVVLLTRLNKPETASIVVQRILQTIAQPMQMNQHQLYINASIGISVYPHDGEDIRSLFQNANHALQLAKEKKGQHYQYYQEKIHKNSQREFAISVGLKRDDLLDELFIYCQPIMNTYDNTLFCVQALLGWRHEQFGLIEQQELFDYAEKQNKANRFTLWLVKNACKQFLQWRSMGIQLELLSVSISVNQLRSSQFIYHISTIIQECQFNAEWLLFEIKNETVDSSLDELEKAINMLKYLKIKLALADFDTNIFFLAELKKLAVDYLVIKQSIIKDIDKDERAKTFAHAMIEWANRLSFQLIIQGDVSPQQLAILNEWGCYLVKGQTMKIDSIEQSYVLVES